MDTRPLTADEQREIIKRDLLGKFQREDWHGVMDAAVDLREHDAYHKGKSECTIVATGWAQAHG